MGASLLDFYYGTSNTEDRWFILALLASLFLHTAVYLAVNSASPNPVTFAKPGSAAPDQARRVNLHFLPTEIKRDPPESQQPVQKKQFSKPELPARPKQEAVQQKTAENRAVATAPQLAPEVLRGVEKDVATSRRKYLSDLLTHIEGHKYYPRSARQRGIEGAVNVSFNLLRRGAIDDLQVSGGPLILQRAAAGAVEQSLPMPPPPQELLLPRQVSFVMRYEVH